MKTSSNSPTRRLAFLLGLGLFFGATAAQAQNYWVGSTLPQSQTGVDGTDYAAPSNWSLGRVPGTGDNVFILQTGMPVPNTTSTVQNQPTIFQYGAANTLTVAQNAMLTINAIGTLNLAGDLVVNGNIISNGQIFELGTATQTIRGSATNTTPAGTITLTDLFVQNSNGVILQTPVRMSRQLSLTGNLTTTTAGTLTLLSTPSLTSYVVNNTAMNAATVPGTTGVVMGTVTMQRAIMTTSSNIAGVVPNPGVGYRHYSSPVSNTTVADLTTLGNGMGGNYAPNFAGAATYNTSATPPATTPFPTIYTYDQSQVVRTNSSPVFDRGWVAVLSNAAPLVPGTGITVNLDGSQLEDFVGTLNNGAYTVNMSRYASTLPNSSSAGYQFLGNPYPSPIDFRRITDAQRGAVGGGASPIYNTLYVYQSTSQYGGSYRTYSGATTVGNPIIPSGQAFMVRMTTPGTSATFTFDNNQRMTTSDLTTFMRPVADTRPQLELTLGSKEAPELDAFNLVFQPGSTTGNNDQYDALKIPNQNGMSLNTTAPNGDDIAIDARPMVSGEQVIPLHVGVSADGIYTLNASKLDNFKGMFVYLRDKQKGTLTDLSQQASYTFNASAANGNARFELVVSQRPVENAPAALAQQVALYPNPAKGSASLELPASIGDESVSASLIDAMGRTVRTIELPAQGSMAHQLDLRGLAAGVYAVRLRTSAGTIVNRLTVE